MGMRLSLSLLPKEKASALWNEQDDEKVMDEVYGLESIAMWDIYQDMPRLTEKKLDVECDIVIGKMDSEAFLKFTKEVQKRAERQIKESDNPLMYWGDIIQPSGNKWELCQSLDWIGALFKCYYIHKVMDWENNYILFKIG
jgi:hypothetical protein